MWPLNGAWTTALVAVVAFGGGYATGRQHAAAGAALDALEAYKTTIERIGDADVPADADAALRRLCELSGGGPGCDLHSDED